MSKTKKANVAVARLEDIQSDEVSLVPKAANRFPFLLVKRRIPVYKGATAYQEFPKAAEDHTWDGPGAVGRLQVWASTDGSGSKEKMDWSKYQTAFLWYNADASDEFGSYKMPVVDVIDGEAKVVWNAVVAAYAAMQGARGGVSIPEADTSGVLARIKQHYEQFEKDWPVEKSDDAAFSQELNANASVPIMAISDSTEERIVTGVVLVPNKEDGQGDIATIKAVEKAAHNYLLARQSPSRIAKLGVMHNDFNRELELVESYIAPVDMVFNGRQVQKGSWVVSVRVLDDNTWNRVKKGEIRGFSLQGIGRGRRLQ